MIRASEPTTGTLQVFQKADNYRAPAVGNEQPTPVQLDRGINVRTLQQLITEPNFYTFSAEFIPDKGSGDKRAINNIAEGFTHARGKAQVLLIEGSRDEHAELVKALREKEIEVKVLARAQDRRLRRSRRRPAAIGHGPASALRQRDPGQCSQRGFHREPAPASGRQLPRHGGRPGHAGRRRQLRGRRLDEHAGRKGTAGRHADQGGQGAGNRRHGADHARQRDSRGQLLAGPGGQGRDRRLVELRLLRADCTGKTRKRGSFPCGRSARGETACCGPSTG